MKDKIALSDILIIVILLFGAVVASPFIMRQFIGLKKVGDILWNVSLDIVIAGAVFLIAYMIHRLVRKYL